MLEQEMGHLRATMAEEIATAIQAASQEMQKTLIDHLTNTLEQTSKHLED